MSDLDDGSPDFNSDDGSPVVSTCQSRLGSGPTATRLCASKPQVVSMPGELRTCSTKFGRSSGTPDSPSPDAQAMVERFMSNMSKLADDEYRSLSDRDSDLLDSHGPSLPDRDPSS